MKDEKMKSKITLAISFLAILIAYQAIAYQAIGAPGDEEDGRIENHSKWVAQCLKDFQTLKPGMTRNEIKGKFPMDGGLQGVSPVRFVHPSCPYFKIDVEFEFKRNPHDQNRAIVGKDDRSTKFSRPYIEAPHMD